MDQTTVESAKDVVRWRQDRDLTQAQAAEIAGVGFRSWQRYEYGERPVPQWLADVLDVRYDRWMEDRA